jgi:acyl-CoA synthetase (AMP-forming)/AMP-acid ligase II
VLIGIVGTAAAGAAVSVLPAPLTLRASDRLADRLTSLVEAGDMRLLLTDPAQRALADLIRARRPHLTVLDLPCADVVSPRTAAPTLTSDLEAGVVLPDVSPADVAVIQYTSGSTSEPKGVVLRHSTILAGLRSIAVSARLSPADVFVNWVPHFHDLGLFGWLACMLSGAATHTFSPLGYIRRPARFLRYFAEHGGTITAWPNFGYDLLLDAADDDVIRDLDLSRWRLAFNGAEPVSAATVVAFAERFAPAKAAPSVMYPVYGMAEATLAVTFPEPGAVPAILHVDRDELADEGRARLVDAGCPGAKAVVSVGRPVDGLSVRLIGDSDTPLGELVLGEVQIHGAGVTDGYRSESANRTAFEDGWLRTGDLGFWYRGELYVVGRQKEMVIVNGQNYFVTDVEAVVRDVPGVERRHCVAVPDDSEYVTVVAETRNPAVAEAEGLPQRIRERVADALGLTAVRVHLVGRGMLPRTTSGKWQRRLVREMIEAPV